MKRLLVSLFLGITLVTGTSIFTAPITAFAQTDDAKATDIKNLIKEASVRGITLTAESFNGLPWSLDDGFGQAGTDLATKGPVSTTPASATKTPTNTGATASKADLLSQGNAVFTTFLTELAARGANPRQTIPSLKTATDADVNAYITGNKNYLAPGVARAQSLFIESFNTSAATSDNYYANYSNAIQQAKNNIGTTQENTPEILKNALLRTDVTIISQRLDAEFRRQTDYLKSIGKVDEAVALQGATAQQTKAVVEKELANKCTFWGWSIINCLDTIFTWLVKNIGLQIAGFLLWVTANMFNYSIQIGVLQFSKWAPESLYPIWIIIRQIISLVMVFVGLYLGGMYILGRDDKFKAYLPWVVMFALFVNFSYPITRSIIDLSNVVSLNIYASAVGPGTITASITDQNTAGGLITSKLGLQGLVAGAVSGDASKNAPDMLKSINSFPAAIVALVFVFYTAYIFLLVTGIFMMRTFVLVFLTVASPILLVDSVIPLLGEKAKYLRKIFFEQIIVGPVFMIMLALTMKFIDIFSSSGALGQNFSSISANTGDSTIKTFFNIIMMLIMLHMMIKVTKSTAGEAGNFASNMMGKVGGFALGAASGGAGLLARQGLGGLAMKARDSGWVQKNQDSFIGRRAYNLSNSVANSTFDLRNTAIAGKMGGIGMGMGMGAKLGQDGASKAALEAQKKAALERSSRIKTHHERDVYKDKLDSNGKVVYDDILDADGNVIKRVKAQELVHRVGDVVEGATAAKERLMASAGGSLFMTKAQKEKVKEAMAEKENDESTKRLEEIKKNASKDVSLYSSIDNDPTNQDGLGTTKTERQENFKRQLNDELQKLTTTDPNLEGKQAQSIKGTLDAIKKTDEAEEKKFNNQVQSTLATYTKKSAAKKEEYLDSQTTEVQEAVSKILSDEQSAAKSSASSGLDLDFTQPESSTSTARATTSSGGDSSLTPFKAEEVTVVDFSARRKAKQEIAKQIAKAEMSMNEDRKNNNTSENPSSPTNSPKNSSSKISPTGASRVEPEEPTT